ncbi:MAG: site-specific integrase [Deltaproteobacteria bacterium]|nr:site-specific integrase [Deltaproteobacteria bacterium]
MDITWRGKRNRIRSPDNTASGARIFEQNIRLALREGGNLKRLDPRELEAEPTFRAFAERWMRDYVEVNNKPSEVRTKRSILRVALLPSFDRNTLREIDAAAVERFKASQLRRGVGAKTLNNYLAVLRRALVIAQEWGLLDRLPKIRPLPFAEKPITSLRLDEAYRLANAAAPGPWRAMILLAALTGVRYDELIALQWEDVRLTETPARLVVSRGAVRGVVGSTKTYRARSIPLPPDAIRLLKEHPRGPSPLVFARGGGLMPHTTACRWLQKAARAAGLTGVGWHVLRHTYVTELGKRGAPLHTVQRLAGHSNIQTTMRYAHVTPEMLATAVMLLEEQHDPSPISSPRATGGQEPIGEPAFRPVVASHSLPQPTQESHLSVALSDGCGGGI